MMFLQMWQMWQRWLCSRAVWLWLVCGCLFFLSTSLDLGCAGSLNKPRELFGDGHWTDDDETFPPEQPGADLSPVPDQGSPSESVVPDTRPSEPTQPDTASRDAAPDNASSPDLSLPEPTPEPTPEPRPEPQPEPTPEPPASCQSQFQFCDDFESYGAAGLDSQIWRKESAGNADVALDTSRAHSGTTSLKFRIGETSYSNRAFAFYQKWTKRKSFYARYWAFLDKLPNDGHHTTLTETGGTAQRSGVFGDQPFSVVLRYGVQQQERIMANFDTPGYYSNNGPGSDCWKHSSTKFPANKWVCMEWYYDTTQKKSTLWLDGQQVLDHNETFQGCINGGVDPNKKQIAFPADLTYFRLGYVTYQGGDTSTHQLWVDDVVIHDKRIGCGN